MIPTLALSVLFAAAPAVAVIKGINPNNPPFHAGGAGQFGFNNCTNTATPNSKCQNAWFKGLDDFCLWAPPAKGKPLGEVEERLVAYCMKNNHGTRLIPKGAIAGATVITTDHYIQVKGYLKDQTQLNMLPKDFGGEADPHGATALGNPVGGIVIANDPKDGNKLTQVVEWMMFIGNNQFCFRACYNSGPHPFQSCMHIYDTMGCDWVMPDKTPRGVFQQCKGEPNRPPGIFTKKDGTVSTWSQGVKPTPSAFPPAKTSACVTHAKLNYATYKPKKGGHHREIEADEAAPTDSQRAPSDSQPTPTATTTPRRAPAHKAGPTGHHKMAKSIRVEGAGDDL